MGAYSKMDIDRRWGDGLVEDDGCVSGFAEEDELFDAAGDASPAPAVVTESQPPQEPSPSAPTSDTGGKGSGADKAEPMDEDAKRKAHEEAEAKRKAEFDAKQVAKKAAEQAQLDKVAAMSDEEVLAASMQRVSTDTEKLTRRNMKECVAEYIQTKCLEDPAFARLTMHPKKSMIHCFWYINRKAREFVQQEMKDNDIKPEHVNGVYGSDVPDDLCYQWAEDYFRDPDAEEDHKDEEKFVPKPYIGKTTKAKTSAKAKDKGKGQKDKAKKPAEQPKTEPKPKDDDGQMSLLGVA